MILWQWQWLTVWFVPGDAHHRSLTSSLALTKELHGCASLHIGVDTWKVITPFYQPFWCIWPLLWAWGEPAEIPFMPFQSYLWEKGDELSFHKTSSKNSSLCLSHILLTWGTIHLMTAKTGVLPSLQLWWKVEILLGGKAHANMALLKAHPASVFLWSTFHHHQCLPLYHKTTLITLFTSLLKMSDFIEVKQHDGSTRRLYGPNVQDNALM